MPQNKIVDPAERYADYDRRRLERELDAAEASARDLHRRLKKMEEQFRETKHAYDKTVANMLSIVQENLQLTHECERLRISLQHEQAGTVAHPSGLPRLSAEELSAIRRAMARLHHPDAGGDAQRMQYWNALLDQIERDLQ